MTTSSTAERRRLSGPHARCGPQRIGGTNLHLFGRYNGVPGTVILLFQLPGANASNTASGVRATMDQLAQDFPPGLQYAVSLDSTTFVTASSRKSCRR